CIREVVHIGTIGMIAGFGDHGLGHRGHRLAISPMAGATALVIERGAGFDMSCCYGRRPRARNAYADHHTTCHKPSPHTRHLLPPSLADTSHAHGQLLASLAGASPHPSALQHSG